MDTVLLRIRINPSAGRGPVKPVNGVGQPPMVGALGDWSMLHYLQEAGIPYSRLHDVGGWLGGGLYVDIPNLFPDFDADETDPASYRFAYTDSLMDALVENGVEPFFRLGVTIENFVERGFPPMRTLPPPDFAKWARICEHVIRHYTEGWADGAHHKIAYWEIWNEPDNQPDEKCNPLWGGPFSEYIRLYGIAAPHLKAKFPHLKIGGYGSCGFYAGVGSDRVPAANSSPRMEYFVDCAREFLAAVRDNGWPMDFFTFHSYSPPEEAMRQVRFADELLNDHGFPADTCERIFNEWLPHVELANLGGAFQASAVAAELIALQHGPCALACIYDARCGVGNYSPLFNPLTQKPHKAYYAFVAFNELRKRGTAVKVDVAATDAAPSRHGVDNVHAAAARGPDGSLAVMLANTGDAPVPFALDAVDAAEVDAAPSPRVSKIEAPDAAEVDATEPPAFLRVRIVDDTRTWEEVPLPAALPPHAILLAEA
ncbi:MAG: GH39 family glycosyl hydrolase [Kiritimatiellia bacterium]|jgi:xylan 1,4-beta-xylosidase